MSDFDKYFAERLDEEGQFPNRERNWKAVSKRLDAYDAGLSGQSNRLRYWQAAAAVSVLAVSVLFGKVYQMHVENIRLRQEIAALNDRKERADAPLASIQAPETTRSEKAEPPVQMDAIPQTAIKNTGLWSGRSNLPAYRQSAEAGDRWKVLTGNPGAPLVFAEPGSGTANSEAASDSSMKESGIPLDILPLARIQDLKTDREKGREDLLKPAPVALPQIKPARHNFTKFRVGVQGVAGFLTPRTKSVSPASGAGLTAEYTVLPNLRLGASADWMNREIAADTFQVQHHFPHIPPKPKFGYKMTRVEGHQRSQYYSLSLAYSLPVHFPVRPVFRLAHTWVRWAPSFFRFKYEKKWGVHPPFASKPEYEPEKSEQEWTSNTWRLGAGLEYESSRWVAGVWADYSKNLADQHPVSDMWFLRAGVQYKFD